MWQAATFGKAATDPPLGNGTNAFYRVQRPNEHTYCEHALRGVREGRFWIFPDPIYKDGFRARAESILSGVNPLQPRSID